MSSNSQPPAPPSKQRDKFAALAATAAGAAATATATATTTTTATATATTGTTGTTAASNNHSNNSNRVNTDNPRRDKFAAVQQLKISDDRQQHHEKLRQRCRQRDDVWRDIDQAEARVTKLLHLASQTALALSHQAAGTAGDGGAVVDNNGSNSTSSSSIDLRETSRQYRETLGEIHRLLSPHADLVRAYEAPSRVNQMYLERVEQRIAESKLELLQELLRQSGVVVADDTDAVAAAVASRGGGEGDHNNNADCITVGGTGTTGRGGTTKTAVEQQNVIKNNNNKRKLDEQHQNE